MKVKRAVLFNKHSGALAFLTDLASIDLIDKTHFKYRIIELDETTERFVGTYETGSVQPIDDLPVEVHEVAIDSACARAIDDVYPVYKQINILTDVVKSLVEKFQDQIPPDTLEPFQQMQEFIQSRRDLNNNFKNAYSAGEDWNYISKDDANKTFSDMLAGGLHEEIGPRDHVPAWMPCGLDGD